MPMVTIRVKTEKIICSLMLYLPPGLQGKPKLAVFSKNKVFFEKW